MSDITTLSDDELRQLLQDVLNEQERRQRLSLIPQQVAELAQRYAADGGDIANIQAAIQ